jgi:hypothetical protein
VPAQNPLGQPGSIVIFGQYKTGTTALFYKIKNSLTAEVRTLFEALEYPEEPADGGRVVLAKVILRSPDAADPRGPTRYDTFMGFDKKLYLVRDPRDWLVSGTLFVIQQEARLYNDAEKLGRVMELLRQKEHTPRSVSLRRILDEIMRAANNSLASLTAWMHRQHEWLLGFEGRLHSHYRIKYEDLIDGAVTGLEEYLEFPLSGSAEVAAEHDHVPRTKQYGNWRDWFVEEDVAYFRPIFVAYLERHGYAPEWQLNESPRIRPEHCTEYVARVIDKRKAEMRRLSSVPRSDTPLPDV